MWLRSLVFQTSQIARAISITTPKLQAIPLRIDGHGTGTIQKVSIEGKPYQFTADTYTLLGGQDSAPSPVSYFLALPGLLLPRPPRSPTSSPSPVSYFLASLSTYNQVTGFVVAKDHGIILGEMACYCQRVASDRRACEREARESALGEY